MKMKNDNPGHLKELIRLTNNASLEAIIPDDPGLDLRSCLSCSSELSNEQAGGIIDGIKKRESLALNENLDVYILLQIRVGPLWMIREILSNTHAELSAKSQRDQEILFTCKINGRTHEPVICESKENLGQCEGKIKSKRYLYAYWKITAHVKPTSTLETLMALNLRGTVILTNSVPTHHPGEYMTSGQTTSVNLVEPLQYDVWLSQVKARISANQILPSEVESNGTLSNNNSPRVYIKHLRILSQDKVYKLNEAFNFQLKAFAGFGPPDHGNVNVQLTFHTKQSVYEEVDLNKLTLCVPGMNLQEVWPVKLPISICQGDEIEQIFTLEKCDNKRIQKKSNLTHTLSPDGCSLYELNLNIEANVKDGDSSVQRFRKVKLEQTVALPVMLKRNDDRLSYPYINANLLGEMAGRLIHTGNHGKLEFDQANISTAIFPLAWIVIKVSAPHIVKVGEIISWKLFVINRSDTIVHLSFKPVMFKSDKEEYENDLHKNGKLLYLDGDVKVGPLMESECLNGALHFLVLEKGILKFEALCVTDLVTQKMSILQPIPECICYASTSPSPAFQKSPKTSSI